LDILQDKHISWLSHRRLYYMMLNQKIILNEWLVTMEGDICTPQVAPL
jgi:hypothetical protein